MRNLFVVMIGSLLLGFCLARASTAQEYNYDMKAERQALKARQKEEWKALKLKDKAQKESWKGSEVPKSMRLQMKHQMQRQKRELREKHQDERQDLKDRQRMYKESQRLYGQ